MSQTSRAKQPKVALVTDWMTSFGGEHRVLHALHELFPDAPIYTTIFNEEELTMYPKDLVRTSFLQKLPFSKKKFKWLLPWMPTAFESFDFSDYDIVISSSHACSKGIITPVDTLHISYCHSPMRYAWEGSHRYIRENAPLKWLGGEYLSKRIMHKIRMWDQLASMRPDLYIANSNFIKGQIKKYYNRDASVIYPPIDTGRFHVTENKDNYYLAGGRLVPNKKVDMVVEAFNKLGLPLKIFGKGPHKDYLEEIANKNIEFVGFVPEEEVSSLFAKAKAFIVPQLEDFGIVTVESLASGTPVIGLGRGGTKEIVTPGISGVLLEEQTPEEIIKKVHELEKTDYDAGRMREHALTYDIASFKRQMNDYIHSHYEAWKQHITS